MKIRTFNIIYDTDGRRVKLPKEIIFTEVDSDINPDDDLADMISDKTGYCVESFRFEVIKE